jgi:hypothetical protein
MPEKDSSKVFGQYLKAFEGQFNQPIFDLAL